MIYGKSLDYLKSFRGAFVVVKGQQRCRSEVGVSVVWVQSLCNDVHNGYKHNHTAESDQELHVLYADCLWLSQ